MFLSVTLKKCENVQGVLILLQVTEKSVIKHIIQSFALTKLYKGE